MVNYNDSSKMLEEKAKIKSIVESLSLEEKEALLKELQRLKSLSELNIAKQILLKTQRDIGKLTFTAEEFEDLKKRL
jgi:hypothetical protein